MMRVSPCLPSRRCVCPHPRPKPRRIIGPTPTAQVPNKRGGGGMGRSAALVTSVRGAPQVPTASRPGRGRTVRTPPAPFHRAKPLSSRPCFRHQPQHSAPPVVGAVVGGVDTLRPDLDDGGASNSELAPTRQGPVVGQAPGQAGSPPQTPTLARVRTSRYSAGAPSPPSKAAPRLPPSPPRAEQHDCRCRHRGEQLDCAPTAGAEQ